MSIYAVLKILLFLKIHQNINKFYIIIIIILKAFKFAQHCMSQQFKIYCKWSKSTLLFLYSFIAIKLSSPVIKAKIIKLSSI